MIFSSCISLLGFFDFLLWNAGFEVNNVPQECQLTVPRGISSVSETVSFGTSLTVITLFNVEDMILCFPFLRLHYSARIFSNFISSNRFAPSFSQVPTILQLFFPYPLNKMLRDVYLESCYGGWSGSLTICSAAIEIEVSLMRIFAALYLAFFSFSVEDGN